jgi:exodeoxyribonuclease VII small subunit
MAKKKTFEESLQILEDIVRQMEAGDLPLEEAVKQYEAGIKQSKYCLDILDKTEQKISKLTLDASGQLEDITDINDR